MTFLNLTLLVVYTNGKLVSDKSAKSKRWKEHFEQLLNHPPVTVPNLPAGPREDDVQLCSVPSLAEVSAAVKRLRNGKAPGLCGISAEMLKASGHARMQWLTDVIVQAWNSGEIPLDWLSLIHI